MKLKATIAKDSDGRLTLLQVTKGKQERGVKLEYIYGDDGFVRDILFNGRKDQMPTIPQILDLVNQSFIERIGNIEKLAKTMPALSTERLYSIASAVPIGAAETFKTIKGIGIVDHVSISNPAQANSHLTRLLVKCDGTSVFLWSFKDLNDYGFTASTPKISLLAYGADALCVMLVSCNFSFHEKLQIQLYGQATEQSNVYIDGLVNLVT